MKKLKLFFMQKQKNKGQSLIEMTVVLVVLLILLMGVVETGNLINQYIILVDGARAGARFGSNVDPFQDPNTHLEDYTQVQPSFYTGIDQVIEGASTPDHPGAVGPIILKQTVQTNQVMISFLSLRGGTGNHKTYVTYGPWVKYSASPHQTSNVLGTSLIDSSLRDGAPNTGILIVEIFYDYQQLLNSPIFTAFVPNPIPVHAYAVFPLSGAEPTPCIGASCP